MSEDETGYCKPPKHTRFEKGRSGNPGGRPKGRKNFATTFSDVLDERVHINENGKRRKASKHEVIIRQIANQAAGGNQRMMPLAIQKMIDIESVSEAGGNPALFTEADRVVIAALHERIKYYANEESTDG